MSDDASRRIVEIRLTREDDHVKFALFDPDASAEEELATLKRVDR